MTGRQVLAALIAILLATAVLPPAAAYAVNQRRVSRAGRDVASIAAALRQVALAVPGAPGRVLVGPGGLPKAESAETRPWVAGAHENLSTRFGDAGVPQDPWGNCYLASAALVLSAGANGTIETAFGAGSPGGDDVAASRR